MCFAVLPAADGSSPDKVCLLFVCIDSFTASAAHIIINITHKIEFGTDGPRRTDFYIIRMIVSGISPIELILSHKLARIDPRALVITETTNV